MLKKLTTETSVLTMEVEERTASITCGYYCRRMCGKIVENYYFDYQENYLMIEG